MLAIYITKYTSNDADLDRKLKLVIDVTVPMDFESNRDSQWGSCPGFVSTPLSNRSNDLPSDQKNVSKEFPYNLLLPATFAKGLHVMLFIQVDTCRYKVSLVLEYSGRKLRM